MPSSLRASADLGEVDGVAIQDLVTGLRQKQEVPQLMLLVEDRYIYAKADES